MSEEEREVEQDAPEPETPEKETPEFDYEAEARKEGWVSQEEWVEAGKPEDSWKPAKDFYDAGQQILPIVTAKNKRLERELNQLKSQVEKMGRMNEQSLQMQRDAWQKELKKQKAKAISDGDGEKVTEIDDQLDKLNAPPPPEQDTATHEALREFYEGNPWYTTDEDMSVFADAQANKLRSQDPNMPPKELLARVAAKTKDAFKHKFQSKRTPAVESGTRGPTKPSKKKDYANLPSEAKDACNRFLENIPKGQQEAYRQRYVENYFEQE